VCFWVYEPGEAVVFVEVLIQALDLTIQLFVFLLTQVCHSHCFQLLDSLFVQKTKSVSVLDFATCLVSALLQAPLVAAPEGSHSAL
jgi:hypothetical protein